MAVKSFKSIFVVVFSAVVISFSCGTAYSADTVENSMPSDFKNYSTAEAAILNLGSSTESVNFPVGEEISIFPTDGPASFSVDENNDIFILDTLNFRVQKISNGKIAGTINYPDGESDDEKFFMRDIAVSNGTGEVFILNATLRNVFVYSKSGDLLRDFSILDHVKNPHKIAVAVNGNVLVRDEDEFKIVVFSPEGKMLVKADGPYLDVFTDRAGRIFGFGDSDAAGRDIVILNPFDKEARPEVFAKIPNSFPQNKPYDYKIIGTDAKFNLYAMIVEQVALDVSRNVLYKFDEKGAVVSKLKVPDFWGIDLAVPTRQFAIAPDGGIYVFDVNLKDKKFVVIKLAEK